MNNGHPHIMNQQQQQRQQRQQQQQQQRSNNNNGNAPFNPLKPVYKLLCRYCHNMHRHPSHFVWIDSPFSLLDNDDNNDSSHSSSSCSIQLMDKDYLTRTCHCRIRDVACRECGNIIGYHVVAPCSRCLQACNNGHFWMFHSDACQPNERKDITGKCTILWNNLPRAEQDFDFIMGTTIPYDQICR